LNAKYKNIENVCVWGNHSMLMYPDVRNSLVDGTKVYDTIDKEWIKKEFIPSISSKKMFFAASTAWAAIDHMNDMKKDTNKWQSIGVYTEKDNPYKFPPGLIVT
jgi:malate dehydrogenase